MAFQGFYSDKACPGSCNLNLVFHLLKLYVSGFQPLTLLSSSRTFQTVKTVFKNDNCQQRQTSSHHVVAKVVLNTLMMTCRIYVLLFFHPQCSPHDLQIIHLVIISTNRLNVAFFRWMMLENDTAACLEGVWEEPG